MKTASKASRKTKRKLRSEERKRKKEKKELMQKNTDEWWNLYHRVTNWDDWRFSEEDMKRHMHLTNHAALDKGQIPSFLHSQAKWIWPNMAQAPLCGTGAHSNFHRC